MNPPLQAFTDWFLSLPPPHRQEIATLVITSSPGYGEIDRAEVKGSDEILLRYLSGYPEGDLHALGVALSLRALIEFFFVRNRGSRAAWDNAQGQNALIKARLAQAGVHPEIQSQLKRIIEETPLRREQWLSTIEKWRLLRDAEFSDEALDTYWIRGVAPR